MHENRLFDSGLSVGRKYRSHTRLKLHIYVLFIQIHINKLILRYIQIMILIPIIYRKGLVGTMVTPTIYVILSNIIDTIKVSTIQQPFPNRDNFNDFTFHLNDPLLGIGYDH
jgi:hypothetical protein